MPSQHRKQRGSSSQAIVAQWFRDHGFPYAESTGAGRSGRDITGMPGVAVEVKARRDWSPTAWLRQVRSYAGHDLPFCVARPDGFGPANIHNWPVVISLDEHTRLLRLAGYGNPIEREGIPVSDAPAVRRRLKSCIEQWPDCWSGDYNPLCCRFPKSCSCQSYSAEYVQEDDLEPEQ